MRRALSAAAAIAVAVVAGFAMGPAGMGPTFARVADQRPQDPSTQFGGAYASLDARRQTLVTNWVQRFNQTTRSSFAPEAFYDQEVSLSAKTTFEAVTHALMTTALTDATGRSVGDALTLVERVESVRGQVPGAPSDRQFRVFVRLTASAIDTLDASREFLRRVDNGVYHKGYPMNYRGQGGTPSIQFSVALDRRQADVDVDYRSSSFPLSMFNGHLSSANSDVRAGTNFDRHVNRWTGFRNWWRSFFGIGVSDGTRDATAEKSVPFPVEPRAGDKTVDVMTGDFLTAWLVEGNTREAMGYVSERSYACLALDQDDPTTLDRGMAPFLLASGLQAARDALGAHASLDGLTVGVRLTRPGLRVVTQPRHAQFVVYEVPDDIAANFDCESRVSLAPAKRAGRTYGRYYGSTFYIQGPRGAVPMVLLWARDRGFWRIVSWHTEPDARDAPAPAPASAPPPPMRADPTLAAAARDFLENWLIRKDINRAFDYLAPPAYACYDLLRGPGQPPSASPEDAARLIRQGMTRVAQDAGSPARLDVVIAAVAPVHPMVRLLSHPLAGAFALTSVPDGIVRAADCGTRASGAKFDGVAGAQSGNAFGMNLRFRTSDGDAPVLRILWVKDGSRWRITAYDVEIP